MPLFLIFLIIPLIEISLFVTIGDEIGLLWTLLLCVVTAVIGAGLVQKQGLDTLTLAQQRAERGEIPFTQMFDGICICIAGVTLITPGFFTDTIGFLLLVPQFRAWLIERAKASGMQFSAGRGFYTTKDPNVIEAEYVEVNDNNSSDNSDDADNEPKKLD